MHESLNRNLFFVKEHVGLLKAANNYDILDPESGAVIKKEVFRMNIGENKHLNPHARAAVIAAFKKRGITQLPDGRKIEEVVVAR